MTRYCSALCALLIFALSALTLPAAQITTIEKSRTHNATGALGSCTASGATNATPIVITCGAAHGLIDYDQIQITGVVGNTNANTVGYAKVTGYSTTTFGLYSDANLTTGVAGNSAYTSGGAVTKAFDVSGVTGDWTLKGRFENQLTGKRCLVSVQESQDGFVSDIRTIDVWQVTPTSAAIGAGVEFARRSRELGFNRFGTANTRIRLYVQAIDSSASWSESFWIEQ